MSKYMKVSERAGGMTLLQGAPDRFTLVVGSHSIDGLNREEAATEIGQRIMQDLINSGEVDTELRIHDFLVPGTPVPLTAAIRLPHAA